MAASCLTAGSRPPVIQPRAAISRLREQWTPAPQRTSASLSRRRGATIPRGTPSIEVPEREDVEAEGGVGDEEGCQAARAGEDYSAERVGHGDVAGGEHRTEREQGRQQGRDTQPVRLVPVLDRPLLAHRLEVGTG